MRARIAVPFGAWIKRFLPRSLLGRSLLMILLPLVLLQAVALQIFYGSHLDVVSRRLSGGVAGETRLHARTAATSFPASRPRLDPAHGARAVRPGACSMEPGAMLPTSRSGSTSSARWTTTSPPR